MFGVIPAAAAVVAVASVYHQVQYSKEMNAVRAANAALNLTGKRAVVVGGTSGIGHGIALRLAKANASVTIVGRSPERGAEIVSEMQQHASAGSESGSAQFDFVSCDCFSLASVKECAAGLNDESLDYLVMSQGMATLQGFTPTPEGLDEKLTLHVYSRAAFANELLPALKQGEDSRVMSVLSGGVHSAYASWKEDPDLAEGSYGAKNAADAAGFYNDIVWDSFARENEDVQFIHSCPGFVATRWGTEMPAVVRYAVRALQVFGRSQDDCAEFLVAGMLRRAEETDSNFRIIDQNGKDGATVTALHEEARETIWQRIQAILANGGRLKSD